MILSDAITRGSDGRGGLFSKMLEILRQVRAAPIFGGSNLLCCEMLGPAQVGPVQLGSAPLDVMSAVAWAR